MSSEGSLTLERGLALLQAVADAGEAATISELAIAIGASRAAVYRLLTPLAARGLVRRDGSFKPAAADFRDMYKVPPLPSLTTSDLHLTVGN